MKTSAPQSLSPRPGAVSQPRIRRALVGAAGLLLGLHGRSAAAAVLDESFGDVPIESIAVQQGPPEIFALAVQADGKIIIGGRFDQIAGQSRLEIARLEANGTLDPSFTSPFEMTSVGATVQSLALDGSGGIFVGGTFRIGGAFQTLVKLKTDGSVDSSFVPEPSLSVFQVTEILASGDKLYVGTISPGGLDRLNSNGSFDLTFNHFADAHSPAYYLDFALQPSGQIVLALDERVDGLGKDGKLVSAFVPVPAVRPKLGSLDGGDVVFFANFAEVNATAADKRIVRVGKSGGVASSFPVDPFVRSFLGVVPGDKILIEQQLPSGEAIVRLTPGGVPDGFVVPVDDAVRTIAPYPGNRLLIAGMFGQVENKPRTRVARLFGSNSGGSGGGGDSGAGGAGADGGSGGVSGGDSGSGGVSGGGDSGGTAGVAAKGGATGKGGTSGSASDGLAASGGAPPGGSSGGCTFTGAAGPSSAFAAWLTIGALASLSARRKRSRLTLKQ